MLGNLTFKWIIANIFLFLFLCKTINIINRVSTIPGFTLFYSYPLYS